MLRNLKTENSNATERKYVFKSSLLHIGWNWAQQNYPFFCGCCNKVLKKRERGKRKSVGRRCSKLTHHLLHCSTLLLFRASNPLQSRPQSSFHLTWNNRTAHIDAAAPKNPLHHFLSIVRLSGSKLWHNTHFKRDTLALVWLEKEPENPVSWIMNKNIAQSVMVLKPSSSKSCVTLWLFLYSSSLADK